MSEELEDARRLLTGKVEFLLSAPKLEFLPEPTVPEIAFAGRSNVGKSTLLNAVTGRKKLARASVTPGRTQELNIFDVGDPLTMRLVDMPGYGYANAPLKVVERWKRLVTAYLRGRVVLKRCMLLIDSRRGIKPVDEEVMTILDKAALPYQIVLTKSDKVKASELEKVRASVEQASTKHPAAFPVILATSSEKGGGIPELRAAIVEAAALDVPV